MPHIIIEHSKGVSAQININELANAFHVLAKDIEALPEGGIRTRVYEADISLIGDGKSDRNFIYITVRLGQGRSEATRRDIGDRLFAVLTNFTKHVFDKGTPLSLGLEIQEIEKDWTWKKNNIHQILKDKSHG